MMKYTAIITMSLLLLGVCSARTLDRSESHQMEDKMDEKMNREDESWNYRREGEQREDQKSLQLRQLKETVYQKLGNMYQLLLDSDNSTMPLNNLPHFTDPIEVGSVVDKYIFGTVSHKNVQFAGLRGARQGVLNINMNSHEATVTLDLSSAVISGSYEASDSVRKASGDFSIKMSKDVSFTCTYRYQVQGSNVQLQHSSGQLHYGSFDSHYENIGFFAQLLQNALGRDLLQTVNDKVHEELSSKLESVIQHLIEGAHQSPAQDSMEKAMRTSIDNAISGIQQVISKQGSFSIDLTSNDSEMEHDKLHAKISSVKLHNIEKFYMVKNQVSSHRSDKLRAKVELAIDRPTATAIVSLHETHDEDAPFQKINVDFNIEKLMAELSLEKSASQSGLEVRSVKTKMNRIQPMGADKFEGRVSHLVKEQMASHMKRYIEQGLKNFIQQELVAIMSQGVLPPSQE